MKARGLGLLLILVALGTWYWGIQLPLERAAAQQPHVIWRKEAFVLAPFAAVFGLFFILTGGAVAYRDPVRQRPTRAGLLLILVAGSASLATFWWFNERFHGYGYAWSGADPAAPATLTPLPAGVPPHLEQPAFHMPQSREAI